MPRLRLALAQIDPTADPTGNAALVHGWTGRAAGAGAHVVAFPEMTLTGLPADGLAARLATDGLGDTVVIVGHLDADGAAPRNALAVLHRGTQVLPDRGRFEPGDPLTLIRVGGVDIALTTGADLRQEGGPCAVAAAAPAGLVVTVDGSPYELNDDDTRLALVARRAAEAHATVACVNAVGARDDLVFDGDSMVVRPDGSLIARAQQFAEQLMVLDLDLPAAAPVPVRDGHVLISDRVAASDQPAPAPQIAARVTDEAAIWQALVLGLRDHVCRHGFRRVAVALSGGAASAVVTALACDALGPADVVAVSLPSGDSSQHSKDDAEDLARRTGVDYRVEPIQPMLDSFLSNMTLSGPAVEHLEARVRGVVMMAIADQEGPLVLGTGDRPLHGDFSPLKDVPGILVRKLARWRNEEAERRGDVPPIPARSIRGPGGQ